MQLQIRTFISVRYEVIERAVPVTYPNGGGYSSIEELRKEIRKRNNFNKRQCIDIENGIKIEFNGESGQPHSQEITLIPD